MLLICLMSPANVPVPAAIAPALGSGLQLGSWLTGRRGARLTWMQPWVPVLPRPQSPYVTLANAHVSVLQLRLRHHPLEGRAGPALQGTVTSPPLGRDHHI